MNTTEHHCRDCKSAAVNVKTHHMAFAYGGTDAQREQAWTDAQHYWWQTADRIAKDCGYTEGAFMCGRMGGWCVPTPQEDDEHDSERFQAFAERIKEHMGYAPAMFADALALVIGEDDTIAAHQAKIDRFAEDFEAPFTYREGSVHDANGKPVCRTTHGEALAALLNKEFACTD